MPRQLHAAVETGGTKLLCRVADGNGRIVAEGRWSTGRPDEACDAIARCMDEAMAGGDRLRAIGIAAFGPLVVDPASPDYGRVLATPKPGWSGSNLRRALADRFAVPVHVDTDVNLAAIAEQALGAGRGLRSVAYVTVGTGIGGGLAIDGRSLKGALHPEIGHIRLVRRAHDDGPGACPFHSDCAEGLIAGPALRRRLGGDADFVRSPETMALVADYLGQLCAALVLAWTPQRIVIGGGIGSAPGLLAPAHAAMLASLGGYGVGEAARAPDFLAAAQLPDAGLEGAMLIARQI